MSEPIIVPGGTHTIDFKILFAVPLNLQEYTVEEEGPVVHTNALHKLICVANLGTDNVHSFDAKSTDGVMLGFKYIPLQNCQHIVDFEADDEFIEVPTIFKTVEDPSSVPSGNYIPEAELVPAEVDEVVDGDTIYVNIIDGPSRVKIRLLGIDTPESVSSNPYENTVAGALASAYTHRLLPAGTAVWLQRDHENPGGGVIDDVDAYGRWLRYVWKQIPDDVTDAADVYKYMVNAILLAKGYAAPFRVAPNVRYAHMFSEGPPVEDGGIPYIDPEDASGVIRVNTGPNTGIMIHDSLTAFKTYPTVPCAVLNNSLYLIGPSGLLHLYMRRQSNLTPEDEAANVVTERVKPLEVDANWAVIYGYNMLKAFPYNFVNTKGATWELYGCLPYRSGSEDIRLNYKPNEEVDFCLAYQSKTEPFEDPSGFSDNLIHLDMSYKMIADSEYIKLFRDQPGTSLALSPGTTEVIRVPINIPNEDFVIRAVLRYYTWSSDIARKCMYYSAAVEAYNKSVADGLMGSIDTYYEQLVAEGASKPEIAKLASNNTTLVSVAPYNPLVGQPQYTAEGYAAGVANGTIIEGVFTCVNHKDFVLNTPAQLPAMLESWDPNIIRVTDPEKFERLKKYGFFIENVLKESVFSYTGGKSMMRDFGSTRGIILEKYDLSTAVGMLTWKQRVILWGVKNAPDLLFASDLSMPNYFPFPNGVIDLPKPVVHVIAFLDSLLVFTQDAIYKVSLSPDGLSFVKETVALNVHFTQYDIPAITIVKNMVFYKADNYYYMLVPSSKILTIGELKVAPVSRPINYFLDHFDTELRLILKDMYSAAFDYADILDPDVFTIRSDYYDVHAVGGIVKIFYIFNISSGNKQTRISFILKYDTTLRTWTSDIIELPTGQMYLYDNNVATGPKYLAMHSVGDTAELSLLSEDFDYNTDEFDNPGKLLGTVQFLDTGFRELGSSWKKRFRELQIKISNKLSVPLVFRTAFSVDNVQRTSLSEYTLLDGEKIPLYTEINAGGSAALAEEDPEADTRNIRTWRLDDQNTFPGGAATLRWRVSGKGYCPRLRVLSNNEKSYEILGNSWVYRRMNAR